MYELQNQPLSDENPAWGRVAVLPWDAEIFGFSVADYAVGDSRFVSETRPAFQDALVNWATVNQVELISCSVPADDSLWLSLLASLGFIFVTVSLRGTLPRLRASNLPATRTTVRLMKPDDRSDVERIAETAFRFGRYHADPHFPYRLAQLRYQRWVHNAFSTPDPQTRVYVVGQPGRVSGFFHVVLKDGLADLRLGAIDVASQSGIAGFYLYVGALEALKQAGARRATAKISAANVSVMNICAALGFRFSHPEAVFHWHAPNAPNLIDLDEMYA
jgi:hypothetical protein